MARSFAQQIVGSIGPKPAQVPKPQSVPGDHALGADDVGEAAEPLRDELGVLDVVRRRVEHARHEHLVVGDLSRPARPPTRARGAGSAASNRIVAAWRAATLSMIFSTPMSRWCGPS